MLREGLHSHNFSYLVQNVLSSAFLQVVTCLLLNSRLLLPLRTVLHKARVCVCWRVSYFSISQVWCNDYSVVLSCLLLSLPETPEVLLFLLVRQITARKLNELLILTIPHKSHITYCHSICFSRYLSICPFD